MWKLAKRYREKYDAGKLDVEAFLDLVKARGYWSVWFTVFDGADDIRRVLIESFQGTCAACFDAQNHYRPIPRNVGEADEV